MSTTPKDLEFVKQGLTCYPAAWATVDHFEKQIERAMRDALKDRQWSVFQPRLLGESPEVGKLIRRDGMALSIYLSGTRPDAGLSRQECWVCLGLHWNPTQHPNATIASCQLGEGRGPVPIRLASAVARIKLGPLYRRNEQFLLLTVDDEFDADEAFTTLLDAFEAGIAAMGQA